MTRIISKEIHNLEEKYQYEQETTHDWVLTQLLCMKCGQGGVYEAENSEVDYGGGNRHKCCYCGFEFYGYILDYEIVSRANKDTQDKLMELHNVV